MSTEVILALIAIVSGGSLTALLNVILGHAKDKQEVHNKDVDDRILAWRSISEKNETRIVELEKKQEAWEEEVKNLHDYVLELEQTILRAQPPLQLPPRPKA